MAYHKLVSVAMRVRIERASLLIWQSSSSNAVGTLVVGAADFRDAAISCHDYLEK